MTHRRPVYCVDAGTMPYSSARSLQLELLNARVSLKMDRDAVIVLEHPPVFTVGRRGGENHLKVSPAILDNAGIELLHIERGGDITYHGPGQLVAYPIFHLGNAGLGVVDFVEKLEQLMILTARDFGVTAGRNVRNHGVWVGERKMGFVGIAVRRSVSFHGIALNVDLSLDPFGWIDPCGLKDVSVTSLGVESSTAVEMNEAKASLMRYLEEVFSISLHMVGLDYIKDRYTSKRI